MALSMARSLRVGHPWPRVRCRWLRGLQAAAPAEVGPWCRNVAQVRIKLSRWGHLLP